MRARAGAKHRSARTRDASRPPCCFECRLILQMLSHPRSDNPIHDAQPIVLIPPTHGAHVYCLSQNCSMIVPGANHGRSFLHLKARRGGEVWRRSRTASTPRAGRRSLSVPKRARARQVRRLVSRLNELGCAFSSLLGLLDGEIVSNCVFGSP